MFSLEVRRLRVLFLLVLALSLGLAASFPAKLNALPCCSGCDACMDCCDFGLTCCRPATCANICSNCNPFC
jgi:hypothetical protein